MATLVSYSFVHIQISLSSFALHRAAILGVVQELLVTRKVSPNCSQETMTCHSLNVFSVFWGQENAPLVTSLHSSCYISHIFLHYVYDVLFFLAIYLTWNILWILLFFSHVVAYSLKWLRKQIRINICMLDVRSLFFFKWVIPVSVIFGNENVHTSCPLLSF